MAKLSPISFEKLVKRLRQLGFDGPYQGGKHPYMIKGNLVLTIPNPHQSRDIGADLISRILKQGGISTEQWLKK